MKSEEEERSAQGVFDSFEFLEEPLFSAVEDKFKFNFQSFEILDEEKKEILIMSYHFSKSRDKSDFALLKTSSKDSFEFINKTKKNNDAYRNLLLFGEGESQKYLTIKDYFRFSSKLVLKPIAQKE